MVTMKQVQAGICKYVDAELLPHLTGGKKIALGIYAGLAAENMEKIISQYRESPAVKMLNIFDDAGNVDIDRLYNQAAKMFPSGEKQMLHIPMIGDLTVDRSDVEKLYNYIRG